MKKSRNQARKHKHYRIRFKINGTAQCPRLCVFKSNRNFEAQLIDDVKGHTLASVNTKSLKNGSNQEAAEAIGNEMAQKIKTLKIKKIVFDRSGYIYHGRVKAFADSVRKEGVKF